jgi:hypothetical protein
VTGLEQITLPDGSTRRLGNISPAFDPSRCAAPPPHFGADANTRLIPRAEWDGLIAAAGAGPEFAFVPPTHDQNGIGQCNPEAVTTAIESCRMQQGLEHVQLSPADLYARINGGQDQGSMLEDAMEEVMTRGVGTAATSGLLWKRGVFKGEAPAAERTRFRVLERYLCPTFDHLMSAAFQGFRIVSGIMWYSNYTPDRDGWLPTGSGQAGGHAIFGYKPTARNGVYGLWHNQSWGRWGLNGTGRFVIPEFAYRGPVGGWWAIRSVTDEGGVIPTPAA